MSTVDLTVSVLGQKLSMPLCVGATAMQRMAHPAGETATARGDHTQAHTEHVNMGAQSAKNYVNR